MSSDEIEATRETDAEPYVAPRLTVLGTLAELTLGGTGEPSDGFGGAGDIGSIGP